MRKELDMKGSENWRSFFERLIQTIIIEILKRLL
jgi:hypothetical protein